jgi:HK97 family phage major capsid protein
MTPEEIAAKALKEKNDFLELVKKSTKDEIELITKGINEKLTSLEGKEKEQGETIAKLKENLIVAEGEIKSFKEKGGDDETVKGIRKQIKSWIKTNEAALANIRAGQKADLTPLLVKTASPMTPANTYNGSAYLPNPEIQAGATEIVRVQPTFWDYIKKGSTGSAAYVWVNKKNPLGAAGFIGPGVAKPGVSFEIATEISNAKKVAVSEKCATELLEDIDGMASWIEMEIEYQLNQKINTTLMTGVNSSTVPAGIQTISVPYSLTTVKTTNPNHWDAIRACVAQLRSGNLVGPVTAFMNPVDYANMVLTKAQSQGQLFIPAETGATIVEDNNVPIGHVQVALLDYYKVLIYKGFALSFGWENDDFTKNLVTTLGEMRLHQFFSENHTGAFIYDTFSNIETALTTI